MGAGTAARVHVAEGGQLMGSESRILGLAIDDQLPQRRWKHPPIVLPRLTEVGEEARHAMSVESVRLPVERSCCSARLLRTLPSRAAEEYDGPNQLIENLLRPL